MIELERFTSYQPVENHFGRKDRYDYAIVRYRGQKMFLKTSRSPAGIGNIKRELVWADFMTSVQNHYPITKLRAPNQLQLLDNNNLLMEYIDAPVVAAPKDGLAWKRQIDRYTDTLVTLDEAAKTYDIPASLKTYQTRQIDEALERWLRDVEITADIQRALDYIGQHKTGLSYRLQHGDMTPWQIFAVGEAWVIFDGERAGDDLPRYNDLAYSYGRLAIRCKEPAAADYMVGRFIDRQSTSGRLFWRQFEPVLAFRLLGMYGDAVRDDSTEELRTTGRLLEELMNNELEERINSLIDN